MKHIKIANINFAFSEEDGLTTSDGHGAYGLCSHQDLTIKIEKKFPSEEKRKEVLLHEVIHGVIDMYDIQVPEDKMESLVVVLARGMMQVFQDNPELVKELFNVKATRTIQLR